MKTFNITPIPQLRGILKNIWVVDGGHSNRLEKMIPFGCMDLVYVENNCVLYQGSKQQRFSTNDFFLTGQVTKSYDFEYGANSKIIGFGFYPHKAHLFTKVASHQLTDTSYHFSDLFSSSNLLEVLGEQNKLEDKINRIQHFILSKTQNNKPNERKQEYLRYVLAQIFHKKGQFNLYEAHRSLNISQRYIQSLFKEYVGISPGLYAKVIRFLNTINKDQKGQKNLTELAMSLGYYDQSHFIRDFKRFTGLAPKQYFNETPYLLEQFVSNESSSLLYNFIPDR